MELFEKIIGNESVKEYFKRIVVNHKLSHSYIFEGLYGTGKKTFAIELAKILLCEEKDKPYHQCKSCNMIEAKTHPDVILIEKNAKVDTIREKVVQEIDIKPYRGTYKIMIIQETDKLNIQAQNALLKTIEEPPDYGIIILLCENRESLLPTIQSRCSIVHFNPISEIQMKTYLKGKDLTQEEQKLYQKWSEGSIGIAEDILQDSTYMELRIKSIDYLKQLESVGVIELYTLVKEITDQKEQLEKILTFWLYWYRDIVVLKASNEQEIYYQDYDTILLEKSRKMSYNRINSNIELIKKSILDLNQNINTTLIIENLLLRLKERKKE